MVERGKAVMVTELLVLEPTSVDSVPTARLLVAQAAAAAAGAFTETCLEAAEG